MIYGLTSRVGMLMEIDRYGAVMPRILIRDGKYYPVEEVKQVWCNPRSGMVREKYLVTINGHDKYVLHEGLGWYIIDDPEDVRTFSNPIRTGDLIR